MPNTEFILLAIAIVALVIALSHAELMVYTQDAWRAAGGDKSYDPSRSELIDMLEEINKDAKEPADVDSSTD